MRRNTNRRVDHRAFSRYADRTKLINVHPIITRGGFRL